MKRSPAFFFRDGEVVRLSGAERIAHALAEVRAELERKPVTDPKVWSGHPDGWHPGDEDDEDDPRVPVGLFLNLERCTRSDPSWQMAMAIEFAFELGKAAIVGEADPVAAARLMAGMKAMADGRRNGIGESLRRRQAKAEGWRMSVRSIWWDKRGQFPKVGRLRPGAMSQRGLAQWILNNHTGVTDPDRPRAVVIPHLPTDEGMLIKAFKEWERD